MKFPGSSWSKALLIGAIIGALTACNEHKAPSSAVTPAAAPAGSTAIQVEPTAFAAISSNIRKTAALANSSSARAAAKMKYNNGEDPDYAQKCGWPANCPEPLPG